MSNHRSMALVVAALITAGCAPMPMNVAMPAAPVGARLSPAEIRYGLTAEDGIMPVEVRADAIKAQIAAYRKAWRAREQTLASESGIASNAQFLGVLIGAAGAIKGQASVGRQGAGVAGVSSLYASHYDIAVQASNYRLGADAMECMFGKVDAVPDRFWTATYTIDGSMRMSLDDFLTNQKQNTPPNSYTTEAYDILAHLNAALYNRIQEIARRLKSAQLAIVLATPSAADIQAAVTQGVVAHTTAQIASPALNEGADPDAPAPPAPAASGGSTPTAAATKKRNSERMERVSDFSKLPVATIRQALQLPAETQACVAVIGSK